MGQIYFILAATLITTSSWMHPQTCSTHTITTGQEALAVLRGQDPFETDPAAVQCIAGAIDMIDELKFRAAIPELVRYLPFKKPLSPAEKKGFFLHPPLEGDDYPALRALARIGEPARADVLRVIQGNQASTLVRNNAAHAIVISFAVGPELDAAKGIEFLKSAKARAGSTAGARDEGAVRYAITTEACKRIEPRCRNAAGGR
jgi:hypothetical protein